MNRHTEEKAIKVIAKILRALRKQNGITQEKLAKEMGIEQSALSRIENGKQILSAPHWMHICQMFDISGNSLISGYLEYANTSVNSANSRVGDFKIPKRYFSTNGTKVRALLPLLNYFGEVYDSNAVEEYFRNVKLDSDYFVNLENQLNINFGLDLARLLIREGKLKPNNISALIEPVNQPQIHGKLQHIYMGISSNTDLVAAIIRNIAHYENNFSYTIDHYEENRISLSISPEAHMRHYRYRNDPVLGDFMCQYKQKYIARFSTFGGNKPVKIEESECQFRGHSKCVYHIQTTPS